MTLMCKFTHIPKLTHFSKQSFGELTPERLENFNGGDSFYNPENNSSQH